MFINGEWLSWPLEYRIALAILIILAHVAIDRTKKAWAKRREDNELSTALNEWARNRRREQ